MKLQTSTVGGPEFYGMQLTTPEEVTEWIVTTPIGVDPREHMSDDERNLFDTAVTPIGSFPINEQQLYFDLIRKGNSIQNVREIAGYDSLLETLNKSAFKHFRSYSHCPIQYALY